MCGILDASAAHKVFGKGRDRSEAGKQFFNWINSRGRLVVEENKQTKSGKTLRSELNKVGKFSDWSNQAYRAGRLIYIKEEAIDSAKERLARKGKIRSNDRHVLALAEASGARLLYSKDEDLCNDFQESNLLSSPEGKIFPTGNTAENRKKRNRLLADKSLCRKFP